MKKLTLIVVVGIAALSLPGTAFADPPAEGGRSPGAATLRDRNAPDHTPVDRGRGDQGTAAPREPRGGRDHVVRAPGHAGR